MSLARCGPSARRKGAQAYRLIKHIRIRAGIDFLQLRAQAGEAESELSAWWQDFLRADEPQRAKLIETLQPSKNESKKRRSSKRRSDLADPIDTSSKGVAETDHAAATHEPIHKRSSDRNEAPTTQLTSDATPAKRRRRRRRPSKPSGQAHQEKSES